MKKLQPTTQFRKDFKRIKNDPEKIALQYIKQEDFFKKA